MDRWRFRIGRAFGVGGPLALEGNITPCRISQAMSENRSGGPFQCHRTDSFIIRFSSECSVANVSHSIHHSFKHYSSLI